MLCNRIAGKIIIALNSEDFRWHDWRAFLDALKYYVPADQREYNEEEKQWYVKATKQNISIIEQLKGQYFGESS